MIEELFIDNYFCSRLGTFNTLNKSQVYYIRASLKDFAKKLFSISIMEVDSSIIIERIF